MKKIKRTLSAILAAAIMVTALSACNAPNNSSSSKMESATNESVDQTSTAELSTLRVMGIDNLSSNAGKDIRLSDWVNGDSKLWAQLTSDLAARGVKLELDLIMEDQYETVAQTSLAAGLNCDLMNITPLDTKTRLSMVEQGKLIALNDLWENNSDGTAKKYFTEGDGLTCVKKLTLEDQRLYWIPAVTIGDYNGKSTGAPLAFQLRKDWLDKLGLSIPKTTAELYDTLVAFQDKDMNGSGAKDEVISLQLNSFGTGIGQWFGFGSEITYVDDSDQKIKSPWHQEKNLKAYITFMQKLVSAGLVDTSDQSTQKKAENKIAGMQNWATETWEEPSIKVQEGTAAPYFVPMIATAMENVEPATQVQRGYQIGSYSFAFTNECKDLKAAGALLDYLSSPEFALLSEYGIKDYTYTADADGNKQKIKKGNDEILIMANIPALWVNNSILPRREINNRAEELITITEAGKDMGYPETGFQAKADFVKDVYDSGRGFGSEIAGDLSVPTAVELEKTSSIEMDLKTYSEELLTKLIFGQQSLDDWEKYMSDFKRLGLDELILIHQARYDRTK